MLLVTSACNGSDAASPAADASAASSPTAASETETDAPASPSPSASIEGAESASSAGPSSLPTSSAEAFCVGINDFGKAWQRLDLTKSSAREQARSALEELEARGMPADAPEDARRGWLVNSRLNHEQIDDPKTTLDEMIAAIDDTEREDLQGLFVYLGDACASFD